MIFDITNGQEQFDSITQSYGNSIEADIITCLVKFINERAKVPFNRMKICICFKMQFFKEIFRNWHYYPI